MDELTLLNIKVYPVRRNMWYLVGAAGCTEGLKNVLQDHQQDNSIANKIKFMHHIQNYPILKLQYSTKHIYVFTTILDYMNFLGLMPIKL